MPAEPSDGIPSVPSMLDLVRLSPRRLFPPGGEELYRQIALLTEMRPGLEVLDVAAGKGVPLQYFVEEFGVTASGVELDPAMVDAAETWSRETRAGDRLQFQEGRSDALPYRDEIFDVAIGEIGLTNHCDPADAISELVRVTKPGGFVVLVQLVWKAPVDEARRAVLSEHLGARPMMVVEWRRLLREAGVEEIHVEDWSDEGTSFRPSEVKPFPDFAELFSLGERMAILRRAWRLWGWRGVSSAIGRENEVHKLLTNERILGLDLLRGRKAGEAGAVREGEARAGERTRGGEAPADALSALPHPADAGLEEVDPEGRAARVASRRSASRDTGSALLPPKERDRTERQTDAAGHTDSVVRPESEGHADTEGLPLFGGSDDHEER
jgi:SAM-dependent methyltransferase